MKEPKIDTFLNQILKEFGIYYTQLVIVVPIIIGAYGLNGRIDPSAWIITMAFVLCLVFTFKASISQKPLIACGCALLIISPLIIFEVYAFLNERFIFLTQNNIVVTIYNSVIFSVFFGILIISSKKQDRNDVKPFPTPISRAIEKQLRNSKFYKQNILYKIIMTDSREGYIWLKTDYSYTVVNRCSTPEYWKIVVETFGNTHENEKFYINNTLVDTKKNVRTLNGRGFEIETKINEKGSSRIEAHFEIEYPITGSELFLTYDPATDLTIKIENQAKVIYVIETHYADYGNGIYPRDRGGHLEQTINTGLLPYEGFHLKWKKN